MPEQEFWARLHPINKKRGFTTGRHSRKGQMYIGGNKPHWYRVSRRMAEELAELVQDAQNPYSAPLFQIMSEAEKNAIDRVETTRRMAAMGLISSDYAIPTTAQPHEVDLTTQDIPRGGREAAVPPTERPDERSLAPVKTSASRAVLTRLDDVGAPSAPLASSVPAEETSAPAEERSETPKRPFSEED